MASKKYASPVQVITGTPPAKAAGKLSAPGKTERQRFTGRLLVRLNPAVSLSSIEQKARTRSLRLISSRDLLTGGAGGILTGGTGGILTGNNGGVLSKGLEQADGILFDRLKIAVVNASGTAQIKRLMALRDSPFLSSEPERYLYQHAGGRKYNLPFKNTAAATWGIQAINARNSQFTGKDVRMAILDTGFDFTHPDFAGRVIHRKSFVGRQAKDREGHGTFCAGIAGGGRKGKAGARYGVAPGSRLYIGKILDDAGEGSDGLALAGIEWALEKGCQVISMSFGAAVGPGDVYSAIFEDVAQTAMANNCLLIAATGNESDRGEGIIAPINHPANCPSVMAVAALTEALKVANYSCAGPPADKNRSGQTPRRKTTAGHGSIAGAKQVNIAAPGDNILSACIGGGYEVESGTSMATPFVAGVAALLWEQYPDASAREIWDKLIRQAQPLAQPVPDTGAGLVYVR